MNTLKAKEVHFTDNYLNVELNDGRVIATPFDWYPELHKATLQQLKKYKFICRGTGIEWEELDYHLSIESMLSADYISRQEHVS